jgi:uncharacterized protein DUF3617
MRKALLCRMFLLAAAASTAASAADVSPGLWEIAMETRVAEAPGFSPAPFQITQCLTEADARDPGRLLGQIANPGASDCSYTDKSYAGNTFSFTMQCAGTFAVKSSGRVSYGPDTMEGTITATANVGGGVVETQNKVSGRRVGGC